MIHRFSSRVNNLGASFFKNALSAAVNYDRIAGYFSSSIIEIAGECIDQMEGKVRILCNSHLQAEDVKFIKNQPQAMNLEWCDGKPEEELAKMPERLIRLYKFLVSGKMEVRVLPNDVFGLIHGKAGVITKTDGSKIAFMGSMNETYHGWGKGGNYEIAWVDDDEAAIKWVQDEFNELWQNPLARPLTQFIVEDIKRIAERKVIYEITQWRDTDNPAATVIEAPVYRKEFGLWEHQKYFVDLTYKAHTKGLGARYVLADMVGLGKTIQLALSAMLMALEGDKPILIITPKTLILQWQEELLNLLDMPSAVWNGRSWVDENQIEYPAKEEFALGKCPRRVGIISQGLIVRSRAKVSEQLLKQQYECVIVDETHRARRKNLGRSRENDPPQPNNLMTFLLEIAKKTKSMLLATATPVQIHPIEAWDLLYILSQGNDFVLGNDFSMWQRERLKGIHLITGRAELDTEAQQWDWLRNPFPPADEKPQTFGKLRRSLGMSKSDFAIKGDLSAIHNLSRQDQSTVRLIFSDDFIRNHNPYIRHIIRRERRFLETTINPDTNQPYLKPITVSLYGEGDDESLQLTTHLSDAYELAEAFSQELAQRVKNSGFIKTMLLRRICSSMYAGLSTGIKMLNNWVNETDDEDDDLYDEEYGNADKEDDTLKNLTTAERELLERFVRLLEEHQEKDPKYYLLRKILTEKFIKEPWLDRGCIMFSQYFDTIKWISDRFAKDFPSIPFGLYAGSDKSGIYENGYFHRKTKEEIKKLVRTKQLKFILGTDAASEGLNLQALGTLINLDLPWNPTRLEQRKGRIQRIGQEREEILIYNMRYRGSVEDRVHQLLASRLKSIQDIFGQIPDTLEDVWVEVALKRESEAEKRIAEFSENDTHPFYNKYQNQENIKPIDWESCSLVLDSHEKRKYLMKGW
ncbi:helicase SNF2 [Niastella koreensis]|uniref:Helicase domain-containing protein n=2 Tax=Niastella koreensis TaxID=354356 RepID=G8TAT0_NIAKG|nr:phospholipase D-like domain-containing anti-phage protein [Niastella koreensis]AEW00273.1 helicase domain-containing protein [Niastella koreensis GR20-10]OQP52145.1 helicase SNF2 [Niastella koreensis]